MGQNENSKNRRKVCPFLGRVTTEEEGGGTISRTWFPPCIGETCAAYAPTGSRRAVCARLGTSVTLADRAEDPEAAWARLAGELARELDCGLNCEPEPEAPDPEEPGPTEA